MSGNITKEGMKADREWMKRVGIGASQKFDAGLNTPRMSKNSDCTLEASRTNRLDRWFGVSDAVGPSSGLSSFPSPVNILISPNVSSGHYGRSIPLLRA